MTLNLASMDAALKEMYSDQKVENLVYNDNPFFAMLPKHEDFFGKNYPLPIIHGNPQGRSRTFTNAQARGLATSSAIKQFTLLRKKDYSIANIDNETMEASENDSGAFIKAAKTEIDGALSELSNNLGHSVFRNSSGSRGQVSAEPATAATTVITLKDPEDVTGYEVGMMLNIYSAETGGTQRSTNGTITSMPVSAVNRSTGVITIAAAYNGSGTIAADDYIFVEGDKELSLSGLDDWIPLSDPTSTPFFGVDRSVDPSRLAGVRRAGINKPIEEALIDLSAAVSREGGKNAIVDYCLLSHTQYGNLIKELGSKVQYVDLRVNAQIGFTGIQIQGHKGPITCVADRSMFDDRAYVIKMSSWGLYSLKKPARILRPDGLMFLRQSSGDGVEVRAGGYAQIGCNAPGWNGVTTLSTNN